LLSGGLSGTAGPMWFKVVQIPATGTSTQGLKSPAALLEILPSEHVGHQH